MYLLLCVLTWYLELKLWSMEAPLANSSPVSSSGSSLSFSPHTFSNHVSIRLTDENYLLWQQEAIATIKGYKRQNHLDKSLIPRMYDSKEYALEGNLSSEFSNWKQQDNLLLSWLLASLSEPIQIWMVGCIYAYHIWDKIEKFFASYPRAKVCQLKFQLKSTKK